MYAFIEGKIDEVFPNYIVVNCHGVGYLIYTPNPYQFNQGENYKIYTYTYIREDAMDLYGFKTIAEKEMFLKLIGVKGLGPKVALPIIAAGSIDGISDAISRGNVLYLQKFPKIGPKLAQQIILDLKGKIDVTGEHNDKDPEIDEIIDALTALGYKNREIKKIVNNINPELTIDEKIKQALQLLLK